jgi:bifunctional DNA-binding transcriptional regulator/antitoxin component of YhaV-PrlF toxin-antitoxin module
MATLRLTSTRQATFPKETCESLGLKPGDVIELEPRNEGGTKVKPHPTALSYLVGNPSVNRAPQTHLVLAS